MAKTPNQLNETKRLMGALVRMKPKPHEEMKLGRITRKKKRKRSAKNKK
jgi:hypothetical protein